MFRNLNIIIENDEFGYFSYCPELEGCHSQGENLDDALKNIKEAIELYLETLSDEEKKLLKAKEIITANFEASIT